MTRNEKSLQALFSGFYDPYRHPYEDDYMSPKFYNVITKDGKIVEEHLTYNRAYEIFNTNPGHYDIVEEITNSRRPVKSGINDECIGESADGTYSIYKNDFDKVFMFAENGRITKEVDYNDDEVDGVLENWIEIYDIKINPRYKSFVYNSRRPIKSSREQKAISKFLDKNGSLVNFDRWSYKNYKNILRKTVDSCAENLALYKDDLKKMDKFVIYETEPNGNIINTLYECSRSEFLDMVREHYREYTGNYPDEDKFDSERWAYVNSSRRPIKSSSNDLFNQIKDYLEGETAGKGIIRNIGNNLYFRSLIITVYKDGYIMRDDTHDKYFEGDTFEEFKNDYWEWVNPF